MLSIKNSIILLTILIASIFVLISAPAIVCSETSADLSSFMDLESSVKSLLSQIEINRKKVVLITVYDSSGAQNTGSGVFIDKEGRILTNASLLKNVYSAEVYSEYNHYKKVAVINRNESADIAILQVQAVNEVPIEPDYEFELKPGVRVIAIGKSPDFKTTVSEGLISSVNSTGKGPDTMEIEVVSELIKYKYSKNGFVINMEGDLIGVIIRAMPNYGDDVFEREYYGEKLIAVSIGSLHSLVADPSETETLRSPGEKIWHHWFLRKVREYAELAFITLYVLGFNEMMKLFIAFVLIVTLLLWFFNKVRKIMKTRSGK